ncbi:MAG: class I adenylate-forming enzyme family protein, partial [Acidimicrobiales bacterium]
QEKFDAESAAAQIAEQRCTAAYLLPVLAHAFADVVGIREAFATVRTGLTIGRPDQVQAVAEGLGVAGICNVYGSTETYGNCCVTPHDMSLEDRMHCQGPPLPGMELRIVDPATGEEVAPGAEGPVLVRGRITPGYCDADELNAETFDSDGWYHTGDVGRIDDAGCFVFTTRDSDMIKTSGINVSPAEVEAVLLSAPDIAEAVVVGAPDAVRGEVVVAFVRAAPGAALDAEATIARCRDELAGYKVPRAVHVVAEMPQTATGKLSRKQLRQLLVDAEATP